MKKTFLGNALLFVGSILFCVTIYGIGELFTRFLSDITFFGNSRNLFIPNAYGESPGNAKNVKAVSFGAPVYTDENGFRIPGPSIASSTRPHREVFLILGDSVAFGPGLKEEQTFSGMLRKAFPQFEIYNSAVIGYSTRDYRNVVGSFLSSGKNVDHVFLLFCLNDVSKESAQEIERFISQPPRSSDPEPGSTRSGTIVDELKKYRFFNELNNFLRSHSKFYLLLKGFLTDPQARYWSADYPLYLGSNHGQFLRSMQNIVDVSDALRKKGIDFTVIIAPYEYQLRKPDNAVLIPQRKLSDYLAEHSIVTVDSTPHFIDQGISSKSFFLSYDPMHFSEKGHKIIYEVIVDRIREFDS